MRTCMLCIYDTCNITSCLILHIDITVNDHVQYTAAVNAYTHRYVFKWIRGNSEMAANSGVSWLFYEFLLLAT